MPSNVLVIEDEPDIRKTIDYNLSKESFKVIQAASIEEGEKALASNKIDVIILDDQVIVVAETTWTAMQGANLLKIKTEQIFHFLVFFKVPNTKLALISWQGPTSEQKLGDI